MKRIIALVLTLATVLCLFAACTETPAGTTTGTKPTTNNTTPTVKPTQPTTKPTEPTEPTQPTEPADPWAEYETITIAKALELCEQFVSAPTTDRYYIRATIVSVDNPTYGQMTIKDETGEIMVYGTYNADGSIRYDKMDKKPVAGDEILIYGTLQNYKGNTKEVQNAWLIDFISGNGGEDEPVVLPEDGAVLTIAEALEICAKLDSGVPTTQRYYITATVASVTGPEYGAMTITDATGSISIYNSMNADGTVAYKDMENKPYKGDVVKIYCTLQNFNGNAEIKSAWIVEVTAGDNQINENDYTDMTIEQARQSAADTLVKVDGTVACMLYANGGSACGLLLVDETGAIYVYDVDLVGRVDTGDKITILASKTYWISSKETDAAAKHGYTGCMQLVDVVLKEHEAGEYEFDKSWITETTVKQIMETPVTNNITSSIFKVTALIKRDASFGSWVNYYIDDLDGKTGSYVYTQDNGKDFAWLDQYDGKICTVYLCPLNAKSASEGCTWRFVPVAVVDDFDPSSVNVPQHVVEYVGIPQFMLNYTGDPALELLTTADSDLLSFAGAALSYASSNTAVINFTEADGKIVMNCLASGTATVTVTATYNGETYSKDIEINVAFPDDLNYVDVQTAVDTAVGETVVVKGIVATSIANKTGFYLIDGTSVIAVLTDKDTMASLKIGQEIIIEGLRDRFHNGEGDHAGQTCITGAKVLVNMYGEHAYDTSNFVTDITVKEFYELDYTVDYTTTVFVLKCTITKGSGQWATYGLTDGETTITLYSGSTAQYDWMKDYIGQEVTVQVAACNWNNKTYYRGCVLSIILPDGTQIFNDYNFSD